MLTDNSENTAVLEASTRESELHSTSQSNGEPSSAVSNKQIAKYLRIEWLGQTVASLCWIASVFTYGISSVGDWLQLFAASAWLIANIASVTTDPSE